MEDYITDVAYISNYYGDLAPVHLSFIAAINNFRAPDILRPFSYCELGCGCGKTTNVTAASYPHSTCVGIDLNKEHIRIAESESRGLSNIAFLDKSFHEALDCDLPKFDFIVMHGIWSWVGDATRTDIIRFVKKFLKPNGLFYVSYNAMPGWGQLIPFHKIIALYLKDKNFPIAEKATSALAYLRFLNENGSAFFSRNPEAKIFLQTLEQSDIRYVIHELFNKHLRPEYFCDVAADMEKAGLTFVGNSEHFFNSNMVLPEQFRKLLDTAKSRISAETHKSIIRNDRFRKDIYAKCKPREQSKSRTAEYFGKFMFGTQIPLSDLKLEVSLHNYTLTLNADPYLKIFEMLSEERLTVEEVNRRLGRPESAVGETAENIVNCMLTGQFHIFLKKKSNPQPVTHRFKFTDEYNLNQIINWDEQYSKVIFLASEITGEALVISKKNALILSAMYKFGLSEDEVVDYVYNFISDDIKKGRNIFGFSIGADIKYLVAFEYRETVKHLLNRLAAFGIISPEPEAAAR
ncbi:MAG: methyltransferase regulatory domain-containing protein [Holosporaceae bacterium]|nr:methyltransferase regulatory domain-containing protein [Holosporaceae bacterium]